jgi:acetamidase/formamidase
MSCHHEIAPLPENMVSGYLDAAVAPVLKIASGDTVRLTSWAAADVEDRRTARWSIPGICARSPSWFAARRAYKLTGPIRVEAARQAVREMIAHICRRTSLAPHEAYMLCSLAGDLRVTQTVDGSRAAT